MAALLATTAADKGRRTPVVVRTTPALSCRGVPRILRFRVTGATIAAEGSDMTQPTPNQAPTADCLSCARSTAPGTRLFSSRKPGVDKETGETGWLCYACQEGSAGLGAEQSIPVSGRYAVVPLGNTGMPGG